MDLGCEQAPHFGSHDGKKQQTQTQALGSQIGIFFPGAEQMTAEQQAHDQKSQSEPKAQSLERSQFLQDEFGKEKSTAPGQDDQSHKEFGGSRFHTKTSLVFFLSGSIIERNGYCRKRMLCNILLLNTQY